jgi:hypothetical protein
METSTDLQIILKEPFRFAWGRVVQIHVLGPFTFVESEKRKRDLKEGEEPPPNSFHVYVDGRNTSRSCSSLESAMVLAIAMRNMNCSSVGDHMAQACCKILDIKEW